MQTNWNEEELIIAVANAECITDVCRNLGLVTRGRNNDTLRSWIIKLNLDISHFKSQSELQGRRSARTRNILDSEWFVNNQKRRSDTTKRRLKAYKPYICGVCKLKSLWENKELVLQLDHINGNHNDNRLENIRFICPNCHTQTKTFAGKIDIPKKMVDASTKVDGRSLRLDRPEMRRVVWPSKQVLKHLIETTSWVDIGRIYGVSDNAVRKWAKKYKLLF